MSKICQKCGYQAEDNMNFCPSCHEKLTAPSANPSTVATPVAAPASNSTGKPFIKKLFQNRLSRKDYWLLQIPIVIITVLCELLTLAEPDLAIVNVFAFAVFVLELYLDVARLHDTEKSGNFVYLVLIPLVGSIIIWLMCIAPGTEGDNQYGPEPEKIFN